MSGYFDEHLVMTSDGLVVGSGAVREMDGDLKLGHVDTLTKPTGRNLSCIWNPSVQIGHMNFSVIVSRYHVVHVEADFLSQSLV